MVSWQTVVLSLGAAVLTAGVALAIGILNNRTQRRLHLRARQIDAASDLSKHMNGATNAVRYARSHPEDDEAQKKARWLVGELTPLVGTISFLFTKNPEVVREATAAAEELARASAVPKKDKAQAKRAIEASRVHTDEFQRAVGKVVGA